MAENSRQWANGRVSAKRPVQNAFAFMGNGSAGAEKFPVEQLDAEAIGVAVRRWCALGHAISFSLSGDGGAFGVHLIVSGEKRSKWSAHVEEVEDFLTTVPGPEPAT